MTTIEAHIPEPVMEQARALAARERIPVEQLISLAVTQTVGLWSHESYIAHRAKGASRTAFDEALAEVPDAPPMAGDEMP